MSSILPPTLVDVTISRGLLVLPFATLGRTVMRDQRVMIVILPTTPQGLNAAKAMRALAQSRFAPEHPALLFSGTLDNNNGVVLVYEDRPSMPLSEAAAQGLITRDHLWRFLIQVLQKLRAGPHFHLTPDTLRLGKEGGPVLLVYGPMEGQTCPTPDKTYAAPEVLRGGPVTMAANIYTIAKIFLDVIDRLIPTPGDERTEICWNPKGLRLLHACLDPDPTRRPTAPELLERLYDLSPQVGDPPRPLPTPHQWGSYGVGLVLRIRLTHQWSPLADLLLERPSEDGSRTETAVIPRGGGFGQVEDEVVAPPPTPVPAGPVSEVSAPDPDGEQTTEPMIRGEPADRPMRRVVGHLLAGMRAVRAAIAPTLPKLTDIRQFSRWALVGVLACVALLGLLPRLLAGPIQPPSSATPPTPTGGEGQELAEKPSQAVAPPVSPVQPATPLVQPVQVAEQTTGPVSPSEPPVKPKGPETKKVRKEPPKTPSPPPVEPDVVPPDPPLDTLVDEVLVWVIGGEAYTRKDGWVNFRLVPRGTVVSVRTSHADGSPGMEKSISAHMGLYCTPHGCPDCEAARKNGAMPYFQKHGGLNCD